MVSFAHAVSQDTCALRSQLGWEPAVKSLTWRALKDCSHLLSWSSTVKVVFLQLSALSISLHRVHLSQPMLAYVSSKSVLIFCILWERLTVPTRISLWEQYSRLTVLKSFLPAVHKSLTLLKVTVWCNNLYQVSRDKYYDLFSIWVF